MIRVAIVGAGPKGLFAAERLAAQLTVSDAAASITVFDLRHLAGAPATTPINRIGCG